MNTVFQIAIEVPKCSDQKVAAIIVSKNNVVSVGFNQDKSHPMVAYYQYNDWCENLHAEASAIINALRQIGRRRLAKCDMYVCRAKVVDGKYQWGFSKPCKNCQNFLKSYPVRNVYYSSEVTGVYEKIVC
jgi:deoxycytidylate deaminase